MRLETITSIALGLGLILWRVVMIGKATSDELLAEAKCKERMRATTHR